MINARKSGSNNVKKVPKTQKEREFELESLTKEGIVYPFRCDSDILEFHDIIIDNFGGDRGLVIPGSLNHAVYEAVHSENKSSRRETIISKATSLLFT